MRIVSLLPSATEIICALGLGEHLVGVSHECDHPKWVQRLPAVTRSLINSEASSAEIDAAVRERLRSSQALYALDMERLESLRPDLIITQALCDVCAVAEEEVRAAVCALPGRPSVVNLQPHTLSDVLACVHHVAQAAGAAAAGEVLVTRLKARIQAVARRARRLRYRPRVAFLEWLDPPFCAGHWTPELVRLAGGRDGLGQKGVPSRTLDWKEVAGWDPEVVFVACCGFNVERTLLDLARLEDNPVWQDLPAVRHGRVYVVDGSHYFNRPGPRLVDSLEILAHTLHPQTHPLPEGLPRPVRIARPASLMRPYQA